MYYVYHYYLQVIPMMVTSEQNEHFNIKHSIFLLVIDTHTNFHLYPRATYQVPQ